MIVFICKVAEEVLGWVMESGDGGLADKKIYIYMIPGKQGDKATPSMCPLQTLSLIQIATRAIHVPAPP